MTSQELELIMKRFKTKKGESFDDLARAALGRKVRMSDIQSYGLTTQIASEKHTINIWLKSNTGVPNQTIFKYEVKNRKKYLEIDDAINVAYQNEDDSDLDDIDLDSSVMVSSTEDNEVVEPIEQTKPNKDPWTN